MNEQDRIVISKLRKITVISLVFMALEFLGGYYAHSIAIFADAFHLLSDVSAYAISLYAVHKSHQISPRHLTFGYEKVQPLGALINVAIIWVVTIELFMEATDRIFHKEIVEEPLIMLGTSVFGLLCNCYIMKVLHSDEHSGHHGCSHSHHSHRSSNLSSEDGEQHHEHGHMQLEHEDHEHEHHQEHRNSHHCQHEHHQNEHQHHQHEQHNHRHRQAHKTDRKKDELHEKLCVEQQQQQNNSPQNLHVHSPACNHLHEEISDPMTRRMSDELIPTRASEESSHQHQHQHAHQPEPDRFNNNINIEAAHIHIITDIILSVGVIISASIIYFFAPTEHVWSYWQLADPLCTYLFSFMAIYSTLPIVRESLLFLLDGCTDPNLLAAIQKELSDNQAVESVENLRVWSTNRGKHYGALRVRVRAGRGSIQRIRGIFKSRGVEGYVQMLDGEAGEECRE